MLLRQKILFIYLFSALSLAVAFGVVTLVSVLDTTKLHVNEMSEAALDSLASELKLELKARVDAVQTILLKELPLRARDKGAADPFAVASPDSQSELLAITVLRKRENGLKADLRLVNEKLLSTRKLPADLVGKLRAWEPKPQKAGFETLAITNRSLIGTDINQPQDVLVLTLAIPGTVIGEKADTSWVVVDLLQDRIRRVILREGRSEVFLLGADGSVILHPSLLLTAKHAATPLPEYNVPEILSPSTLSGLFNVRMHQESMWLRSANLGLAGTVGVAQFPVEGYLIPWIRASQRLMAVLGAVASVFLMLFLGLGIRFRIRINRIIENCNKLGTPKSKPEFEKGTDELGQLGKRLNGVYDQFRNYLSEAVQIAKEQDVKVTDQLLESTSYGISPVTTLAVDSETFVERCRERPGFFGETVWWGPWLGFFVGHATSPGFSGSLTAIAARSAVLSLAQKNEEGAPNPAEILARIHQVLLARGNGSFGLAAYLCFVNLDTGEVKVSSANQRGPLLLHRVRGKVEDLSLEGSWLGLKSRPTLQEAQFEMEVGDSLLFCSSGLLDATDSHGKILGESSLSRLLVEGREKNADALKERLSTAFRGHVGEMALTDDAVFWLIQWKRNLSEVSPPVDRAKEDPMLWKETKEAPSTAPQFQQEEAVRDALNFDAKEFEEFAEKKKVA